MKTVKRFDTMKIDGVEVLPGTGFVRFKVFAGRTGIQKYRKADGSVLKEFRPPEEVFAEDTLGSLRGAPFTNNHPKEKVTTENAKDLMVGFVGDTIERVKKGKLEFQKASVTVSDAQAIEDIKKGKMEVSLGYDLTLDESPGEFEGERYDAVQRNIEINHLALVDVARGGPEVRLRLDSDEAVLIEDCGQSDQAGANGGDPKNNHKREDRDMAKVKIGDREFDLDKDAADAVKGLQDEMSAMRKKLKEGKKDGDETAKLEARIDHLGAELEKSKAKEGKMDDDAFKTALGERRRLEKVAEKCLDSEKSEKLDEMSNGEIKKAVIEAEAPGAKLDGKSDAYIDARFDHIAETLDVSSEATKKAGEEVTKQRKKDADEAKEDGDDELAKKRADSQKRDSEAWTQPTATMKVANK